MGCLPCVPLLDSLQQPQQPSGCNAQVPEQKGLDIVRRDWCPLSKDVGNFVLAQILSGRPAEDVVLAIHNQLMEVRPAWMEGHRPWQRCGSTTAPWFCTGRMLIHRR